MALGQGIKAVRKDHRAGCRYFGIAFATAALVSAGSVHAQNRSSENVVLQADDAFGTNVGRESIGLYNSSSVRGFSPSVAGNVRIDGLYFDQVADIDSRLRRATAIRIGFSTFGFSFPAPTGVVDYQLRRPGAEASRSLYIGGDSEGGASLEGDAVLPVNDRLSIGLGAGVENTVFPNGTDFVRHVVAVHALWRPVDDVEVLPFASRSDMYDNDSGPNMVPVGATLPPFPGRGRFMGPDWANSDAVSSNYGVLGAWRMAEGWTARMGLFRSEREEDVGYSNMVVGITPDGMGRQIVSIDPASDSASTSGELRLSRRFVEGDRLHQIHLSMRGRDRVRRFGGGVDVDLGPISIYEIQRAPRPNVVFGEMSHDEVRQWIGGVSYEGRWRDRGELSLGVQKVDYEMSTHRPGAPLAVSEASPLLWNAALSVNLGRRLAVYAGTTRGLEESGVAPAAAANRNAALPAIETEQLDAGLRWRLKPGLNLIAGVFDIRKPYSNLDENNVWRELGEVHSQGVEVSLSGEVRPGLNVLAGAVLTDAEVTGEAVRLGRVGRRPVGSSPTTLLFNADWRPAQWGGVSFDVGVSHAGDMVATRDNRVEIPARTTVDLGMRYPLRFAGARSVLRAQVRNVTDEKGFSMRGSGAFGVITGRVFSLSLASDF